MEKLDTFLSIVTSVVVIGVTLYACWLMLPENQKKIAADMVAEANRAQAREDEIRLFGRPLDEGELWLLSISRMQSKVIRESHSWLVQVWCMRLSLRPALVPKPRKSTLPHEVTR